MVKSKRSQKRASSNKLLESLDAANKEHAKEEKLLKRSKRKQQIKTSIPPPAAVGSTVKVTCEGGPDDAVPSAFSPSMMMANETDDAVPSPSKLLLRNLWAYLEMRKKRTVLIPTPIQLQSWPVLLKQPKEKVAACTLNLIGIAPTGSGKTLAYGVPMVTMCVGMRLSTAGIYGLVLAPTRELAIQIGDELTMASYGLPSTALKIVTVHGGVDGLDQIGHLSKCMKMPMILVATPGRLMGLIEYEKRLENWLLTVKMVVLDEADRLAIHTDMAEQVDAILGCTHLPRICLYSATYPRAVKTKWNEWATLPRVCIKVNTMSVGETEALPTPEKEVKSAPPRADEEQDEPAAETNAGAKPTDVSKIPSHIGQLVRMCEKAEKSETMFNILTSIRSKEVNARQKTLCIIFFDQIKTLQNVYKRMVREGIGAQCAEFHGQLSQAVRQRTLANFRCGKITTLLATDIVARGIHVNNVELVINYDFPESLDQYVHRCGRAGRSKAAGKNKPPPKAVVHSFLTREAGADLANEVLTLLHGSTAWIDPKLLEFAGGGSANANTNAGENGIKEKKAKRRKV